MTAYFARQPISGQPISRRTALGCLTAGGLATSLGWDGGLARLPAVRADEAKLDPHKVQFDDSIEPVVRLLEETPREKLLEEVAARVKKGLAYREVLAGLLLAGVRNVQPRPEVGFKFHSVLVVNSAHLASMASPDEHRWLPIFWAIDHFKSAQEQDRKEGDWTMRPVDEKAVPKASQAKAAFIKAMDAWDEAAADAAAAGLARHCGAAEVFELFYRYGCRDFRAIGHKAIYVANSRRTLACIGWQHAEPVIRSLAYALLNHRGQPNPATSDLEPDRAGRRNLELAKKLRDDWRDGTLNDAATKDLLATFREATPAAACDAVAAMLQKPVAAQSVWDALLVGAAELLVRQPGIVGLHAMTSANALHYAYADAAQDDTRRLLTLQAAAFLPHFLAAMKGRGKVGEAKLDTWDRAPQLPADDAKDRLDKIFQAVSGDRAAAAEQVLDFLALGGTATSLIDAARVLVFTKGRDAHDYKFSSAALEDYAHVSPSWRNRYLAASVYNLRGSRDADNPLNKRIQAALGGNNK